jgi:hypothetical protein
MMLRKLWTRFCLLANYRKFLILVGLTILSDILYETATGGLTEPVILTNLWIQSAVNSSATYCYRGSHTSAAGDEV